MTSIRRSLTYLAVLGALGLFCASPALASTHIWTGPSGGVWSNPANWSGGVPATGEPGGTIVQFGSNTSSNMDVSGLVVDEIHFTGSGNSIGGTTALGINGSNLIQNVVSDGAGNSLGTSLPIALSGANTEVVSAAGTVSIGGAVSGSAGLVFVSTGGGFSMTAGNTGDSYAGSTVVESGVLHMASANGVVVSGSSLSVGGGGSVAQLVDDQSSDISHSTAISVGNGGTLNLQSEIESGQSLAVNGGSFLGGAITLSGAVTVTDGSVALAANGLVSATSLNMMGGSISGPTSATLMLSAPGTITATSSAAGPATISTSVALHASPTITVSPGAPPELRMTGPITESGGSQGFTKAGAGTLVTSGANTYTGMTTISAGILEADGSQPGPVNVGQSGTLTGSGTIGDTTVAGILAPVARGMNAGSLDLQSTARLDQTITSVSASTVPSVLVTGSVTIDASAALNLVVSRGIAVPHGSQVVLIGNDGSDPINGRFGNLANGSVVTTPDGVPLVVNYTGGDGNDLALTAGNVQPQLGTLTAAPNPGTAGQPVAFSVTATDANQDPLTIAWNFGDGTAPGTGTTVSHTYAAAGTYTVVATVSDGLAQSQSTTVVTVKPNGSATAGAGVTHSTAVTAAGFGAIFRLTFPTGCERKGARFSVRLSTTKHRKAKGKVLQKVSKVVFALSNARPVTDRSAPFSAQLTVGRNATSGSILKLTATASLTLHGGEPRAKRLIASLKIC